MVTTTIETTLVATPSTKGAKSGSTSSGRDSEKPPPTKRQIGAVVAGQGLFSSGWHADDGWFQRLEEVVPLVVLAATDLRCQA